MKAQKYAKDPNPDGEYLLLLFTKKKEYLPLIMKGGGKQLSISDIFADFISIFHYHAKVTEFLFVLCKLLMPCLIRNKIR